MNAHSLIVKSVLEQNLVRDELIMQTSLCERLGSRHVLIKDMDQTLNRCRDDP